MAGKVSLAEVKDGRADLVDLLKINALLDMQAAAESAVVEKARKS